MSDKPAFHMFDLRSEREYKRKKRIEFNVESLEQYLARGGKIRVIDTKQIFEKKYKQIRGAK